MSALLLEFDLFQLKILIGKRFCSPINISILEQFVRDCPPKLANWQNDISNFNH